MKRTGIINLACVDDIPLGQGMCFIVGGQEVAVFRSRSGKIFAIENRCPHRQGPLAEGLIDEGKVICPLHGHKFDLMTGKGGDHQECVRVFLAWVEGGNIYLQHELSEMAVEQ